MRVPPARPRIDVEEARKFIESGKSASQYAREHGFRPAGVRKALLRIGVRIPRRRGQFNDVRRRRLHALWKSILDRCAKPRHPIYRLYGARGVRVCREWRDFENFETWALANGYGRARPCLGLAKRQRGYRPGNCQWVSRSTACREGQAEALGPSLGVRAFGERKSILAWSKDPRCQVCHQTLRDRLDAGMSPTKAITRAPQTPGARNFVRTKRKGDIDWKRVRHYYVELGLGVAQTAEKLGCSYHGVLRGLQLRKWFFGRPTPVHELRNGKALYKSWCAMRERCLSPRHPDFARIGGKRIRFAREWEKFEAFHAWSLSAGYRPGLVFTRIDRGRDYAPANCTWLPRAESIRYRRPEKISRRPRWTIRAFGEEKGPFAWTRDPRCTVILTGLVMRLKRGLPPAKAITARNKRQGMGPDGRSIEAFGTTKSIAAWARDRRAQVGASSILARLRKGIPPEKAIRAKPYQAR